MSSSVYGTALLVHGAETLLSDRAVAARLHAAVAEVPDAEVVRLEGREVDAGRFVEATGGSLFSAASVVVVNSLCDVDKDLFDLVADTAAHPSPDLCLVLVHPGGVKGKGLLDRLRRANIETVKADAPKPWQIPDFIGHEARRLGLDMDRDAADALHRALGNDLRTLAQALDQLGSDRDGQRIDAQAVTTYFGGRAEVSAFTVADAVIGGRVAEALEQLRWALSSGVAPVMVTSAVASSLRSVGLYLDVRKERIPEKQMAQVIGVPPWKMRNLVGQARSWNAPAVARAIRLVTEADASVKGAAVDPDYALEAMVLGIVAERAE